MSTSSHYTFGDNDVAAFRLRLLAEVYEPSTSALLATVDPPQGGVLDLGCGPGYTTRLLHQHFAPAWTLGLERSPNLLAAARQQAREGPRPGLRFEGHDVTCAPLPAPPVALLYARFLLTHLPDPVSALRVWRGAALPGGRLIVEETVALRSEHPAFRRYYQLVQALQAHYGQVMEIGPSLPGLAEQAGWEVERFTCAALRLPADRMARLHALNLQSWSHDPFAQAQFDATELEALSHTFDAIAHGSAHAPPVSSDIGQLLARAGR